jgi:hypothetical protein
MWTSFDPCPPNLINMYWLLASLLLSSAMGFETCDECVANIEAFGNLTNEHKV